MRALVLLAAAFVPVLAQPDTAWVRTRPGPHGHAWARLVGVAPSGDVYAAGYTDGASDSSDYLVLKYDGDGVFQWERTYSGPANGNDYVTDLAVDGDGNCYVTGQSAGASGDDYATIKYLPNGDTAWVRRYSGPVENDQADAVCVDGDGNVYVSGYSVGSGTASDIVTIKYDAGGTQQWLHRYDGGGFIDWGHDIAVDDSGYVYVAGQRGSGIVTWSAFAVKYTPGGTVAWTWASDPGYMGSAERVAPDGTGGVYLFGSVFHTVANGRYLTVRLTGSGDTMWTREYSASGEPHLANDMALDGDGNVYVTGGGQDSNAVYHYVTVSYDAAGTQRWVRDWHRTMTDIAWGIALGNPGEVYVTGSSDVAPWVADVATLRLDATTGAVVWESIYDGPAGGSDACLDIAVGPDGLPVAAGSTADSVRSHSLVIKYDPAPGLEERTKCEVRRTNWPTFVRGVLFVPRDMTDFGSGKSDRVPGPALVDITGREVMSIEPGANDVSHLAPGVYFVTREGPRVRKVAILR